jgi:hypothetical protein
MQLRFGKTYLYKRNMCKKRLPDGVHLDISTVRYEPTCLTEWINNAMQVVEG